mgnify:CR=1 FL=1|jgi:hypothetical protein
MIQEPKPSTWSESFVQKDAMFKQFEQTLILNTEAFSSDYMTDPLIQQRLTK